MYALEDSLGVVNRFIVKAKLNSIYTNDYKRKYFFSENVHNCRLSHFNINRISKYNVGLQFFQNKLRLKQVLWPLRN